MENLEEVFEQIRSLGCDLSAEIVIQEEESEIVSGGIEWDGSECFGSQSCIVRGGSYRRVIKPRIAEPNEEKREKARVQLNQIYDSFPLYSARYEAGMRLGIGQEEMQENMSEWIDSLLSENGLKEVDSDMPTRKKLALDAAELLIRSCDSRLVDILAYKMKNEETEIKKTIEKSLHDMYTGRELEYRGRFNNNCAIRDERTKIAGEAINRSKLRMRFDHTNFVQEGIAAGIAIAYTYAVFKYAVPVLQDFFTM